MVEAGHHRREIGQIVLDLDNVSAITLSQVAVGATLSAPIEDRDREAPARQITQRLAVFLNELGAPGKHDDCSARGTCGPQMPEANAHPVHRDVLQLERRDGGAPGRPGSRHGRVHSPPRTVRATRDR